MPILNSNPWFVGTEKQTNRYRAIVKIEYSSGGITVDPTNNIDPFLISVRVFDGPPHTVEIELDDRDGRLALPAIEAKIKVSIGWSTENMYTIFSGSIHKVESGFDRKRGGRRVWIHGSGALMHTAIKAPKLLRMGAGAEGQGQADSGGGIPFSAMAMAVAGNGDATALIGASLASIQRDRWEQNNESAMEWFTRMASEQELGANFCRVQDNNIILIARFGDFPKTGIVAQWGDNLISWKIEAYSARPMWLGGIQSYYESWNSQAKEIQVGWPGSNIGDALFRLPNPAPNANIAQQQAAAGGFTAPANARQGHLVINGEPQAVYMGTVTVKGARPGVDGTYFITAAEHLYSRQGYITNLDVTSKLTTAPGGGTFATVPVSQNAPAPIANSVDGSLVGQALGGTAVEPAVPIDPATGLPITGIPGITGVP